MGNLNYIIPFLTKREKSLPGIPYYTGFKCCWNIHFVGSIRVTEWDVPLSVRQKHYM